MKNKKVPLRMCVITHERFEKKDLIRVVKDNTGNVFVDTTGKMNGKGAYLKKDISVIEEAQKKKILDRVLEIDVPNEIYEELKTKI